MAELFTHLTSSKLHNDQGNHLCSQTLHLVSLENTHKPFACINTQGFWFLSWLLFPLVLVDWTHWSGWIKKKRSFKTVTQFGILSQVLVYWIQNHHLSVWEIFQDTFKSCSIANINRHPVELIERYFLCKQNSLEEFQPSTNTFWAMMTNQYKS